MVRAFKVNSITFQLIISYNNQPKKSREIKEKAVSEDSVPPITIRNITQLMEPEV